MKVDGVDFAEGFVESFKTEKAFIDEMNLEGYKWGVWPDAKDRTKKLKEVYKLHKNKSDNPVKGSAFSEGSDK